MCNPPARERVLVFEQPKKMDTGTYTFQHAWHFFCEQTIITYSRKNKNTHTHSLLSYTPLPQTRITSKFCKERRLTFFHKLKNLGKRKRIHQYTHTHTHIHKPFICILLHHSHGTCVLLWSNLVFAVILSPPPRILAPAAASGTAVQSHNSSILHIRNNKRKKKSMKSHGRENVPARDPPVQKILADAGLKIVFLFFISFPFSSQAVGSHGNMSG